MASQDEIDTLTILKAELNFLEDGGYGRSVRTPWKPTSIFLNSPTCLSFADPQRTQPCSSCLLMALVPESQRASAVPCHHIPLTTAGDTVQSVERRADQQKLEEIMKGWLRATIQRLEHDEAMSLSAAS